MFHKIHKIIRKVKKNILRDLTSLNSIAASIDDNLSNLSPKEKSINYLVGPGDVEWKLKEHWLVNDADITEIFWKYRTAAFTKCSPMTTTLKPEEELALSHIFVLQEENLQGLSQYFKEELWQQLFDNIRSKYPHQPVPTAVHDLVNKVMNITYSEPSHHRCRNIIKTFLHDIKPATDSEEIMFKILRNLAENNTSSFSDDYNEDTFIHDIIEPVVKPFFANNRRTAMKWSNTTSISLAQMKKKFDPTLMGVRPDFIVHTINYNNYIELLIGEFKPPGTKVSLVNEDFVCLGKTMKYCLDKGIEDGMEDLVIGGLQVIGFLGHIYIMDLCFDGVYRMILLGEILFPEGIATWGTLIRCFQ
ncbi:1097_t:CDS:2, partial [Entrophospora sp. SA101]